MKKGKPSTKGTLRKLKFLSFYQPSFERVSCSPVASTVSAREKEERPCSHTEKEHVTKYIHRVHR